jgi:cytosine/adenosine deaminase-related metal-dependent hydrolase
MSGREGGERPPVGAQRRRARWVLADGGRAWDGGVLSVVDGRVASVSARADGPARDLGDVIVVPGPINAHVHFDLSLAAQRISAGGGMAAWLEQVVALRRAGGGAAIEALHAGLDASTRAGTAAHGDVCSSDVGAADPWSERGFQGVVYREVLGLKERRYEPLWLAARAAARLGPRWGVSPHAPYSTAAEVYRRCGDLPDSTPLATHWLESDQEVEFLATGRGPIRDFLERIGAWTDRWTPPTDPWETYLGRGRWNLVHCNCLSDADVERMRSSGWRERIRAATYCPRTHDWFGHGPHRWRELLAAGVPVALGTDSLASNPDLSVWNEARWLAARSPDVSPKVIFDMLTIHGARALGLEASFGTLAPGKSASALILRPASGAKDPWESLFDPATEIVGPLSEEMEEA